MKNKSGFVLFFFLCLILILLFMPKIRQSAKSISTKTFSKISGGLVDLGTNVENSFSFIATIHNLKKQNEDLSDKITRLQIDKSQIEELKNENDLLKKELGFAGETANGALVPAKIIERDPDTFFDYLTIDRGAEDGIEAGDAVVFSGALAGQIKEVMAKTSTVTLITSKESLVQAMLQSCRAKGILKGGISGPYLENITRDTEYEEGEFVITSGLGGEMKQGILIGTAGKLISSSSGIFKTLSVEPIIDLSKLELVFVQK